MMGERVIAYVAAPPRPWRARAVVVMCVLVFGIGVTWYAGMMRDVTGMVTMAVIVATGLVLIRAVEFVFHAGPVQWGRRQRMRLYAELKAPMEEGEAMRDGSGYAYEEHLGAALAAERATRRMWFRDRARSSNGRAWAAMKRAIESRGLEMPRTIADEGLRESLLRIPLTRDLLEPEEIEPMSDVGIVPQFAMFVVVSAVAMAALQGVTHNVLYFAPLGMVVMAVAAFVVMSVAKMRPRMRLVELGWGKPVAGCGVVRINERVRFMYNDSVMLVRARRFDGREVQVTIVGECGVRSMLFKRGADARLAELWQRWNHLDPKPELLE